MSPSKKIYWILGLLTLGSYGWIGYHLLHTESHASSITVCLFKNITGIPCPSCGVTRSVLLFIQGEFLQAMLLNPLGILAIMLLLIIPAWIGTDLMRKKTTLISVYTRCEGIINQNKLIYIPLIIMISINWIWNITKGL